MKVQYSCGKTARGLLGGVALAFAAFASQGQIYTLTAPNAVINGTPAGMVDWIVNGEDQLALQAMFFRIGSSGPETLLTGGTFAGSINGPHAGSVTYNTSGLRVKNTMSLTGASGSEPSRLNQTIAISNTSGSAMDLHFFLYSDFNLRNMIPQAVQIGSPEGYYSYALQTGPAGEKVVQTFQYGLVPNFGEAGLASDIYGKLTDALPTTLNGQGIYGPGDAAWAFQWDIPLAANGGATISLLYSVPEPSTVALGLLGLALIVANRKSRQ